MGQAVPAARDTRLKREKDKTFFCSEVGCADGSDGKDSICNARRPEFDPWVGKIPWKEHLNPLQYSYLENPRDRGAAQSTDHGVVKSQT